MDLRTEILTVWLGGAFLACGVPACMKCVKPKSRAAWALWSLNVVLIEWIFYRQIDWTLVSLHLRYVPCSLALYCIATTFPMRSSSAAPVTRGRAAVVRRVLGFGLGIATLAPSAAMLVEMQRRDTSAAVPLSWPLGCSGAYVAQGGPSELRNHHVPVPVQRRALDIVTLDGWGRRMQGVFPRALNDYAIYGCPVRAPCTGTVTLVESQQPERSPLALDEVEHLAGNFVSVYCPKENVTVVMAHLQPGVHVALHQELQAGAFVGRVGNSGNTTEPHLHVHAVPGRARTEDALLRANTAGVALTFDGRRLTRGDRYSVH